MHRTSKGLFSLLETDAIKNLSKHISNAFLFFVFFGTNADMTTLENASKVEEEKKTIYETFNQIASRYDLANFILSFGIDRLWRRKLAFHLPIKSEVRLLDLATGTADQIISIMKRARSVKSAIGLDMATEMLAIGKKKIARCPFNYQVSLLHGNAAEIPLNNETVDCVTISFGIRNVSETIKCLEECYRVLSAGGRLLILEFSMPEKQPLKKLYRFYLHRILPFLAGLISSKKSAYQYLNASIETFPKGKVFLKVLEDVGFKNLKAIPLSFGIATLYSADKIE